MHPSLDLSSRALEYVPGGQLLAEALPNGQNVPGPLPQGGRTSSINSFMTAMEYGMAGFEGPSLRLSSPGCGHNSGRGTVRPCAIARKEAGSTLLTMDIRPTDLQKCAARLRDNCLYTVDRLDRLR